LAPRFLLRLLRADKEKEERDEAETDGGKTSPKGHTAYKRVMFSLSIMKSSSINDGEFMRPLFFFALGG
jgi:hypothetical protein